MWHDGIGRWAENNRHGHALDTAHTTRGEWVVIGQDNRSGAVVRNAMAASLTKQVFPETANNTKKTIELCRQMFPLVAASLQILTIDNALRIVHAISSISHVKQELYSSLSPSAEH